MLPAETSARLLGSRVVNTAGERGEGSEGFPIRGNGGTLRGSAMAVSDREYLTGAMFSTQKELDSKNV